MLFTAIHEKGPLSKARAKGSAAELRKRWAAQISDTVKILHNHGIVWGDAKADNILIDVQNNAWVIDFGGSYTVGWVDTGLAGTPDGDLQGLSKILSILS